MRNAWHTMPCVTFSKDVKICLLIPRERNEKFLQVHFLQITLRGTTRASGQPHDK